MTNSLQLSVIISTYTQARWDMLRAAVASVHGQSQPAHEIIVAVDHNFALFRCVQEQISGIQAVANASLRGAAGTRNSGIAVARGEVIAFLDDDAIAAPDWLERIATHYRSPHVLGVGGASAPLWLQGRPSWFPEEFDWVIGCSYRGMPQTVQPVRNLWGCNMSLRREVLDAIGGFNTELGPIGAHPLGYCEETELCIRATRRYPQGVVLYDPEIMVSQWVPPDRATWRYFLRRCYAEGLSKAMIARMLGAPDALASERTYAMRILTRGMIQEVRHALRDRNPTGIGRAAAIVAGLLTTTTGYLRPATGDVVRLRHARRTADPGSAGRPTRN